MGVRAKKAGENRGTIAGGRKRKDAVIDRGRKV